jgi:hypothetical protein
MNLTHNGQVEGGNYNHITTKVIKMWNLKNLTWQNCKKLQVESFGFKKNKLAKEWKIPTIENVMDQLQFFAILENLTKLPCFIHR